jgi:hypothetical protein
MRKPLTYTDEVDPSWADTALAGIAVSVSPDIDNPVVLDLTGPCPRCKDTVKHAHWLIAFSGVSAMSRDDAITAVESLRQTGVVNEPLLPTEFSMQCNCDVSHPDRLGRTGLRGCGAVWRMRFDVVDEDVD